MSHLTTTAFHGDVSIRDRALQRLRLHASAGQLTTGALFWSEERVSAAAALIDSADPDEWTRQLGLAPWLAYAIDAVVAPLPAGDVAQAVESILNDIAPGTRTGRLGSAVLVAVLDELAQSTHAVQPLHQQLHAAILTLRALHDRAGRGEPLIASEWRAGRAAAMQAADLAVTPGLVAIAACLEAGAWDPHVAPVTVGEMLRFWVGQRTQAQVEAFGWTDADHQQVQRLLDEMHDGHIAGHPEEDRDVFQLLAVHHPAVEERLRAFNNTRLDASAQAGRDGLSLVKMTLKQPRDE